MRARVPPRPDPLDSFHAALEARHLSDLAFKEVRHALQALSSLYVERRERMAGGAALEGRGKRAAFALYYGPLHFVATEQVLAALDVPRAAHSACPVLDLGCGTGAVGAAVARWSCARRVHGFDVHPWALDEARATYASFGLDAAVTRASVARFHRPTAPAFIVAGYVANELPDRERDALLRALLDAVRHGSSLLIIEPLSGRAAPWWPEWVEAFTALGARADTWTLTVAPPEIAARLGKAAGLSPTSAKLRTIAVVAS